MSAHAFTLSDGTNIPSLAWGTAGKTNELLGIPLSVGLLHMDCAQGYNNEKETGDAIKKSGLKREEIYLTTKLSQKDGRADDKPIPLANVRESVLGSIERLGTQPNLLLVHNPFVPEEGKQIEFWRVLEEMVEKGELQASLGVSNYRPQDLELLLKHCKIKPVVNQLEYHPYVLTSLDPIVSICKANDIRIEAYGPLTPLLRHPTGGPIKPILSRIANRLASATGKEVDEAAVLLLWTRAKGAVAVSSSKNEGRIKKLVEIGQLLEGALTDDEVREIEEVGRKVHFRNYSEHLCVDYPAPDLPQDL